MQMIVSDKVSIQSWRFLWLITSPCSQPSPSLSGSGWFHPSQSEGLTNISYLTRLSYMMDGYGNTLALMKVMQCNQKTVSH